MAHTICFPQNFKTLHKLLRSCGLNVRTLLYVPTVINDGQYQC